MKGRTIFLLSLLCLISGSLARKGFGKGEQEWDFVEVRPKAHMFWWLYYTTAKVSSFYDKPLVIWLQGGPGGSSTSYGNFEELGPLDTDLNPRNYTWVKDYNVLFIDNPVGTGFSFVNDSAAYATNNAQIAKDLVECMKGFYKKLPKFKNVPTYITTESYGGKMGAEFALVWYKQQLAGNITSNLKGVALGDAWISPIDSVMTWAPFLLATGMVDTNGFNEIDRSAKMTQMAVDKGNWDLATNLWGITEQVILKETGNIDFYNILTEMSYRNGRQYSTGKYPAKPLPRYQNEYKKKLPEKDSRKPKLSLEGIMNGPVRDALKISVKHCVQCSTVFAKLTTDFMKPVVDKVERLLNETDLKVVVLNGHMDLIVDTPGTLLWVERMHWNKSEEWLSSARNPLVADGIIEGFVKSHGNLAMYWINRAGHMVPKDNPAAMAKILTAMTTEGHKDDKKKPYETFL